MDGGEKSLRTATSYWKHHPGCALPRLFNSPPILFYLHYLVMFILLIAFPFPPSTVLRHSRAGLHDDCSGDDTEQLLPD